MSFAERNTWQTVCRVFLWLHRVPLALGKDPVSGSASPFFEKKRLHNQIFFRNQVGQGAPTDYSIYYTTKSYTIVQTFSTNLLHKYNKLFEFYNSTNTQTFCDKQPYMYSLLPKSDPVACCKFHPLDNEVTTVSIQIKWNKPVPTTSLHGRKELRLYPIIFC